MSEIFTIQGGAADGGCDAHENVFDDWLSEIHSSLQVALAAIDDYDHDERVRKSMKDLLGIKSCKGARKGSDLRKPVEQV